MIEKEKMLTGKLYRAFDEKLPMKIENFILKI